MKETEQIEIFRNCGNTLPDMSEGIQYVYEYRADYKPNAGSGLNPPALACSKVTGRTLIPI
jgi:hypothetical protein